MRIHLKPKQSPDRRSWRSRLQGWSLLVIAPGVAALITGLSSIGWLEPVEWMTLDLFFRWRPPEPPDHRITVVTITDQDITNIGQWPIPDKLLARALSHLHAHRPRVIGLDLYRDFPVEPGHQELLRSFQSIPNLIGVQRAFGLQKVPPPPVLDQLNRVADASIPEDGDKRVRRALLTGKEGDRVYQGLGLALALKYLEKEQIIPLPGDQPHTYRLGLARIEPFRGGDGGYANADDLGYQLLLNYRGSDGVFQTITLTEVLQNRFQADWVRDRVILIGTTAESVKDLFLTPYGDESAGYTNWTSGVIIHANIVSQILSAAQDGRPLLRGVSGFSKHLWVMIWAFAGVGTSWQLLQANWVHKRLTYGSAIAGIWLVSGGLVVISYLFFLNGWWFPVAAPVFAVNCAAIVCFAYHSYKLQHFAYFDGLTQVANRRYFDLHLARQVYRKGTLSLILCDVDYFKLYNDTYGHPAGDRCLQQVAFAIRRAVRWKDFVARYGGEEFAVIIPALDAKDAVHIAERITEQVRQLKLPHQASKAADHVTISCGVATVEINAQRFNSAGWSGGHLIAAADQALYQAKAEGRNRVILNQLE